MYKSATGNANDWVNLNLNTNLLDDTYRLEIACAVKTTANGSNSNCLYVMASNITDNAVVRIIRSADAGITWSVCGNPVTLGVGGDNKVTEQPNWCMALAVDPNNQNKIYVGGENLFRGELNANNGFDYQQLSWWYESNAISDNVEWVHADQHTIVFKAGSSSEAFIGCDGGVYRCTNLNAAIVAPNIRPTITAINNFLNITQFYSTAASPAANDWKVFGGTQDNGTHRFTNSNFNVTEEKVGGDGGFCFVDANSPNTIFSSYVNNNWYRSTNGGIAFVDIITDQTGRFINPSDFDSQNHILYTCSGFDAANNSAVLGRYSNMTNVGQPNFDGFGFPDDGNISHIKVSPNTPTTIYVGFTSEDNANNVLPNIRKITNANTQPIPISIIGDLPVVAGMYISSIDVEVGNENNILVTFSNYGVSSVFKTTNGGINWVNLDPVGSNLSDIPVRWGIFAPGNPAQILLATEVGVWSTNSVNGGATNWGPSTNGLANVRVDMLKVRSADKAIFAATHGRGMFRTDKYSPNRVDLLVDSRTPCQQKSVDYVDNSNFIVATTNTFHWDFDNNGVIDYIGRDPAARCANIGEDVTLTIKNAQGGTLVAVTKIDYIKRRTNCVGVAPDCPELASRLVSPPVDSIQANISNNDSETPVPTTQVQILPQPLTQAQPQVHEITEQAKTPFNINIYPNPFYTESTLEIAIENEAKIDVRLFDISGKEVLSVGSNTYNTGTYKFVINGETLNSGVYFCVIKVNDTIETKKIVLIK